MQEVNAWLTGDRDFNLGSELYLKYGQSSFFKELLAAGPTPYNIKKLGEELESLAPSIPATPNATPEPPIQPQPVPQQTLTQQANDHKRYIELCKKRDETVLQIDRNMAALHFVSDRGVLHETAKQILRLYQRKIEIWALIDQYQTNQCFEPVYQKPEKSREEKMQLIYQSLSKARKRLADPDYKDKSRTKNLIAKKLEELEHLKGGEI